MEGKLIFLHGASSVGKSTLGTLLQHALPHAALINQDTYFYEKKPFVTIDNKLVQNWDCDESIDYHRFVHDIQLLQKTHDYVIVTGFALRNYLLHGLKPTIGFLLESGLPPEE